jgi:hypothetical protein
MIIALDYDDTFTLDPTFWTLFIESATKHGHKVICVTARRKILESQQELMKALPSYVETYFSYDEPKADYVKRNNIVVDVWIDDSPGWIVGVT